MKMQYYIFTFLKREIRKYFITNPQISHCKLNKKNNYICKMWSKMDIMPYYRDCLSLLVLEKKQHRLQIKLY